LARDDRWDGPTCLASGNRAHEATKVRLALHKQASRDSLLSLSKILFYMQTNKMLIVIYYRELNKQIMEQNKQLSKEQTTNREYTEHVFCTNVPTAEYYNQFNTTTR
jgi:hypothetical protein